ncbi:MAG: hydrogenase maturation nickel metallochaperone HypA [Pseudomonadota bacterium]
MHEMAIAQSVVEAIEAEAPAQSFSRVRRVVLEIGALSHIDPDALSFGFDAVTHGTLAEGAALEVRTPPGEAYCFSCDKTVTLDRRGDACPECGSHQLIVTGGEELKIKALEVV